VLGCEYSIALIWRYVPARHSRQQPQAHAAYSALSLSTHSKAFSMQHLSPPAVLCNTPYVHKCTPAVSLDADADADADAAAASAIVPCYTSDAWR
jgi:hypothetical protein